MNRQDAINIMQDALEQDLALRKAVQESIVKIGGVFLDSGSDVPTEISNVLNYLQLLINPLKGE